MSTDEKKQRVTRDQALKWLESNAVNRRLRPGVVDAYRRDMEGGRWEYTGEPIQLSRTGQLLNGQHRLTALAGSSCKSIEALVVTGLPDRAQKMMDQGASRGVADALRIAHGDVKNVGIVSAITRWMVAHPEPGLPNMLSNLKRKVSAAEAVQAYEMNPDIQYSAERAMQMRGYIPGSTSGIGYAFLHINRADSAACNEFFGAMVDLSFSVKNDPRKAALRRLQDITSNSETRGDKATSVALISVLTRAWNAWRKGEEISVIMARNSKGQPIDPVTPV